MLEFSFIFLIIIVFSYYTYRDIQKSLLIAQHSEHSLKHERDILQRKITDRTQELKQTQFEKVTELYRFAEFGRISSGMFHDLMIPLSAVALSVDRLARTSETLEAHAYIEKALIASKRMEKVMTGFQKQIAMHEVESEFEITPEIEQVQDLLTYKARQVGIEIRCMLPQHLTLYGNALKFHQAITNLISNAIDAYDNVSFKNNPEKKYIDVSVTSTDTFIVVRVQDSGCGIPSEILPHIFEPFFTTKALYKGTGIGLSTTKKILEHDFRGSLEVESTVGKGTLFTLSFPLRIP